MASTAGAARAELDTAAATGPEAVVQAIAVLSAAASLVVAAAVAAAAVAVAAVDFDLY